MRALTYDRYTDAAGLRITDVPQPRLPDDRVLVGVAAAGLNPFDWHMYRGEPWFMRMQEGWRVGEPRTVGADLAGVIEAVGADVEGLAPGDRVMGSIGNGALAEFALASPRALAKLPASVPFDLGAAIPMAGLTALQALRDDGRLAAGERVLVWGASGGVGHLAVQLARVLGAARVDAVCSGRNADLVRSLGADEVIDYTTGARPSGRYDVIVDTVATASVSRLTGILSPGGRVATVGATSRAKLLGPATAVIGRAIGAKLRGVEAALVMAKISSADLTLLAEWLDQGTVSPVIAREYAFEDAVAALHDLETGRVAGKLVVRVQPDL